ncbi:hypothetical protein S518_003453 [Salmonella enterica subsp. enterica]|nr:hypothetical protein [Salmonella enterica subsp. enterica]EIE6438395.1 hypothetical protein [Salmonella enterica]EIG1434209.1 hypothetical protein [Salmonella enterica]EIG1438890.1 hypothetical protein [Salmonella enterica]ELP2194519.1 hypothetical protein [Salmonella enterica subsp. enterica serovar Champaign]
MQAGGDVSLTSRDSITLDGFTGTTGSLLLNATGSVINTALLYAGNNLSLFANNILNRYGDILAGNNLVMQKDATGMANAEVVNTSGNIETTKGDITINTRNLLNQRDNIKESTSYIPAENSSGAKGGSSISVRVGDLAADEWGYYFVFHGTNYGGSQEAFGAPTAKGATIRYSLSAIKHLHDRGFQAIHSPSVRSVHDVTYIFSCGPLPEAPLNKLRD